jgi:Pretoxin HINT domain
MKISNNLAKVLKICLVALLLIFYITAPAYARGGCFANGTKILTPNGDRRIEDLHKNDRIIGYNFNTHQTEEEDIGGVQVIKSPDYYIIDDKIKVTGTHPFYVQISTGLNLVEVKNLKLGDSILGEHNYSIAISKIEYVKEPVIVYNLLSVTPHHNF